MMASHLQEVKIRVKNLEECSVATRRILKFNPVSMICGHEFKQDACQVSYHCLHEAFIKRKQFQGDSGGPFFIETDPNRYEVFGVVSFGDGCATSFPGIYGRISEPSTLKWIKSYIKSSHGEVCQDPYRKAPHSL
jgi:secreted trypsin-like serine protease